MSTAEAKQRPGKNSIKCVVWDLDNTIWDGTLLEDREVALREKVVETIKSLDGRGILQSIASKNEHDDAMAKLQELGIWDYFIYPQIGWVSKSSSIKSIAEQINISLDTVAFIDDQRFELEEVLFTLPEVLCIDSADLDGLLDLPEMSPRFITQDSRMRRLMYASDIQRKRAEQEFNGPKEEFLATLGMEFIIATAKEEDLKRAEELTVRTNQLNTTGYTYSYQELDFFRQSERHRLLIARLNDKYGEYGNIGLALVECSEDRWMLKLLLMSCRVMSRGVGTVLLSHIMQLSKNANARLLAEFIPNDRNRMMYMTYKFSGFKEVQTAHDFILFEHELARIPALPGYLKVRIAN
jgi:FkbH-like protein